jgi:hypothetical protein
MNIYSMTLASIIGAFFLAGCSVPEHPDFEYDILGDADEEIDPLCTEEFAFCGDVLIPHPFEYSAELMAVGLYRSLPPMGPP